MIKVKYMNYYKNYYDYISYVKTLNRYKGDGNYYEKHHIIPKSLGGSNNDDNLVLLTAREHYLAHYLLCKINTGVALKSMIWAFHRMTYSRKYKNKINSSRLYEALRIKNKKILFDNIFREKISKNTKGRVWINNGIISKMVKNNELENFLSTGWNIGRLQLCMSNKPRKKTLSRKKPEKRYWISNPEKKIDKMVPFDEIPIFLEKGWIKGRKNFKSAPKIKIGETKRVYNPATKEEKNIKKEFINEYLKKGWILGRNKLSEETKRKMKKSRQDPNGKMQQFFNDLRTGKRTRNSHSPMKYVNKNGEYKMVKLDEIEAYLNNGWQLGGKPKSQEWKEKISKIKKERKI